MSCLSCDSYSLCVTHKCQCRCHKDEELQLLRSVAEAAKEYHSAIELWEREFDENMPSGDVGDELLHRRTISELRLEDDLKAYNAWREGREE